jgi:hypothetical protein
VGRGADVKTLLRELRRQGFTVEEIKGRARITSPSGQVVKMSLQEQSYHNRQNDLARLRRIGFDFDRGSRVKRGHAKGVEAGDQFQRAAQPSMPAKWFRSR